MHIPYIDIAGRTITEPKDKVEALNDYFSTVGENLNKFTSSTNSYVNKKIKLYGI